MDKLIGKIMKLRTRINSRNGQINVSIPRKQLDTKMLDKIKKSKNVLMSLEGFE